jgi:beta-phosphoglucomutase-like phosphatase (HAD superfamily)
VFATLVDFDGVLVDSEPVHLAAFNDALAPHGIVISARDYAEQLLSQDDAAVFRTVLSRSGGTLREEEVRRLVDAKGAHFFARFAESFRVFPGAPELLARRSARGPVGIVSGALEREITFALDRMEARATVAFIVSAERPVASKPDPAPFRLGLEELKRLGYAGAVVAIEDSLGGVASARGAGVRCAAVTHTYSRDELLRAGADVVVADLASLTDALLEG